MFEHVVRQGVLVAVATLIVCLLGTVAALRIPVQMIPDLEVRTVSVQTGWPGATPQDVEQEILLEQEQYLRNLPNLRRMVSIASTGRAVVELEFPFGVDINEALIRTSNALSQVPAYPENVDEPVLSTSSFSENAFMYFRIVPAPGNPLALDLDLMRDYVEDHVRPRLERVPGVSQVDVGGGAARQVRIVVDPHRLAERGLGLGEVRDAVRARNRDASGGDIDQGKRSYLVRTIGRFADTAELEALIVARRGDTLVRLRDIATVALDHAELRGLSYTDGEPTLGLSLRREPGANVIAIKRAVLPVIEEINRDLLARHGLSLHLNSDDVRYVQDSIANVWTNLALGAVLAVLVLFAFLRSARATAVGALGIPVCTVAAFIGLLLAGRTVNVISLAGIAFAIGMTLDNAIVVLESIEQARRRGLDRARAAVAGVREVWPAVLASTLTTVLVFAPILFIREEAGQLYSDVAIAIASAILASMLVATVLVPAACARLGFGGQASGPAPGAPTRRRLLASLDRIHGSRRGRIAALAGTVLAAVAVVALLTPPAEYLPEGEESKTFSVMIAPPGYNLAEMARIGDRLRADLAPALAPDAVTQPDGLPALAYYNLNVSARNLRIIAEPRDPRDIDALMDALDARFEAFPGMRAFSSRGSIISSNDGGTRSVNLDIAGTDLAQIYRVAERAYRRAEALFDNPRIGSDPGSLSLDQPLVEVRPDWLRLAELGFGAQDFGYAVAALSDGAYVDELILGDDKIDIFLFGAEPGEQSLQRLRTLPVAAPDGSVLPLESLARLDERADTDAIRRVDGRRTVTLNIVPPRSVALETAVARVGEELVAAMQRDGEVPAGVTLDISGAADQLDATRAALSGNFLVAVAICYLLLVAIFGHWGLPLLILVTVPLGMAGGLLGLAALNLVASQPFDMITMLGFLVLLGTVVNNPILIVDRAWQGLHRDRLAAAEAVREAVASRLRPILMTTLTTVFGLAPLVFLPGAGTELYRGLGVVVLSGLVCSTVVTLVFLPSLLVVVLSWRQRTPATAGGA